ncbi:O-methyltransferase [Mycena alexandri]|uniref:O-methyltransferase n=1 Tax=Mycena alexandri TaxID=1745969 RepID=A0AAD6X6C7_9AGAR|nr:O-methyltransferase [Mycena alexandri]KAJ7033819.1 O-methyltransferase [Mycena alexandri]
MDAFATLRALSDLIADAVTTVERTYKDAGLIPPPLDTPFDRADPAEALRRDPVVAGAVQKLVAAAGQITAIMRDPVQSIVTNSHAFQISSCLRAAAELHVAEILKEAGPKGLHVKHIAARGQVDPSLLARILRLLATHHIFREVTTDVFANTRISSILDKGKSADVLYAKPHDRFSGTDGLTALVEFLTDDCFKSSSYMTDAMLDPSGPATPHMLAFQTDEAMYQWLEKPNNEPKLHRFGIAMQGTTVEEPEDTIFRGFPWDELPAGSVVVDVAGGLGASTLFIAKKFPTLKIVNQDRGPVIEQSKAHWREFLPSHVDSGMVEFQVHDVVLEPQPVKNASAFLLRNIVHNLSDADLVAMLTHLRTAALPTTRLVILEYIAVSASRGASPHPYARHIPILGARRGNAPEPLLANYGVAGAPLYYYDLTVHNLLSGTSRTVEGFYDVLRRSGWNLLEVYHCPGTVAGFVIADPL